MKVFISQPMKGKSNEEIQAVKEAVIEKIRQKFPNDEISIIESFVPIQPDTKFVPLWYLGKSLQLLSDADLAYFVKGYETFRGCKIEFTACKEYGIPYMIEED